MRQKKIVSLVLLVLVLALCLTSCDKAPEGLEKGERPFLNFLWVLLISMVPIIELRGGIPVGAALGLPFWACFLAAVIGNLIPVPFILLFIEKSMSFMKRHHIFRAPSVG